MSDIGAQEQPKKTPKTSSVQNILNSNVQYISTATLFCSVFLVVLVLLFMPYKENVVCCDSDFRATKRLAELEIRLDSMQQTMEKMGVDRSQNEGSDMPSGSGATYIRWGRTVCPENISTAKVYDGFAAGDWYEHNGGGTELLCLPSDPTWGNYSDNSIGHAYLYGTEYEINAENSKRLFNKEVWQQNVPCAVCYSVGRYVKLMIPGRIDCYNGWKREYKGYLMTGHHGHAKSADYSCVDEDPESVLGNAHDQNGRLLYQVEASCHANSLPCPPYVQGREIACVVCTR